MTPTRNAEQPALPDAERPGRVRARLTHTCPCGCGRRIPNSRILCADSWTRVPGDLRQAAHRADEALMAALDAIITWIHTNPGAAGTPPDGASARAGVGAMEEAPAPTPGTL